MGKSSKHRKRVKQLRERELGAAIQPEGIGSGERGGLGNGEGNEVDGDDKLVFPDVDVTTSELVGQPLIPYTTVV